MAVIPSSTLTRTRAGWHRVAEHVLAAGQFAAAGTIRLHPVPGGIATTVGVDGRQLALVGDRIAVREGTGERSAPLTTLRAAAEFAGVEPGLRGSYPPSTPLDLDAPLDVDPAAAQRLAGWFALGDEALRRFAADRGAAEEPVLWAEHLDVAITVDEVNYGASPGDDGIDEPYVYIGPHTGRPAGDAFWNAPFGAAATAPDIRTADDAVAFFSRGRALIDRSTT